MKNFILKEDLGQSLVNYLSTKPYSEVATFIQLLLQLEELTVNKKEDATRGNKK